MTRWILMAGFVVVGAGIANGQTESPLEPPDTSSPRATLTSFRASCEKVYALVVDSARGGEAVTEDEVRRIVGRMLDCLDLSEEPDYVRESAGREAAVCLMEVLDRIELPPLEEIPGGEETGTETGVEGKGLSRWRVPGTSIYLERMGEGPRQGEYLFSAATVTRAREIFESAKGLPYREGALENFFVWYLTIPGPRLTPVVNLLPDGMRTRLYGNQAPWQWLALGLTIVVSPLLMFGAYFAGRRLGRRIRERNVFRYFLTLLFPVAAMLVPLFAAGFIRDEIRVAGGVLSVVKFAADLVFLLASIVVIVGFAGRMAELIVRHPKIHPKGIDAQLTRILCRVLGLGLATIVFLEGGKHLGIPITTLLASAGVGGFALALAAQDSLKNFFGSMMIILDKPYRVGQRIVVKGYDGVVEGIGLRSTRLRLLNGHQVTIPNEEMARSDIENIGRRPHIRRLVDLRLPLDTPLEKVERAVEIVRETLKDHEGMEENLPPRAYFTDMKGEAMVVRFIYWYHPPHYWDFLKFSEGVNLRILRTFEAEGIAIDSPRKILDVTEDRGAAEGIKGG